METSTQGTTGWIKKNKSLLIWLLLALFIKTISFFPGIIEKYYSTGLYPFIAGIQRILLGWIPFSLGDIFYAILGIIILVKTYRMIRTIFRRKFTRSYFISGLKVLAMFCLYVYVFFNLLWGLNYDRRGIAYQLQLDVKKYSILDLDTLAQVMLNRVNEYAVLVTQEEKDSMKRKRELFDQSRKAYAALATQKNFLAYRSVSVKPSIYSYLGNYFGFQGYYNPFSGEAQVNTIVPPLLRPYITTHEMAHQLGYARENEANFVGFLACRSYDSKLFRYSVYFDMFNYTIGELYRIDSLRARHYLDARDSQFVKDVRDVRIFFKKYQNWIQDLILEGYSFFLKANKQPAGKRSYNEVVSWLIAYYKKFGIAAL